GTRIEEKPNWDTCCSDNCLRGDFFYNYNLVHLFFCRLQSANDGHKYPRSQTLPIIRAKNALSNPKLLQIIELTTSITSNSNETDIVHHIDLDANIATEVCLTVLDLLCLFNQSHQLLLSDSQSVLMKKVFDNHLLFLQINQSVAALRHVFAALRMFVCK
ncbi:unnamed protein product, partial [Staurois parvus]